MCSKSESSSSSSSTSSTCSSRSPARIAPDRGTICRYNGPYYWYEKRPKVVDMGYGDFDLQIDNTVFKTHRHHLVKFRSFAGRIGHASPRYTDIDPLKLDGTQQDADDMADAFKIIYASVLFGPFTFEPPVLISAFRTAKKHDHPELRTYCIERLEECEADLTPMQRIEFARAFDPDSREVATYDAMSKRDKPFTEAETRILGMLAWSMVTRVRRLEKAKSEPESVTDEIVCEDDYPTECGEQELLPVRCGRGYDGESRAQRGEETEAEEAMDTSRTRDELERMEEEERKRGYEEALQRYQERGKEQLPVSRRAEELSREREKGSDHGWEEVGEQEWKGGEPQWKDWKLGETSNSPIKGKNNPASRAFSALSSRYLAVAGRICGKPGPAMESPETKDDSTLFEEYADESKYGDFDEKKRLI